MCRLCPRNMAGGYSLETCATCQGPFCLKHIEWNAEKRLWECKRCIRKANRKTGIAKATLTK